MKQSSFMLAWTKAMLSTYGPPKSTTRHVLLTLATHMNGDGTSCYPSQKTLAAEACMSHVAIYKHLKIAARLGWIGRWLQKERGRDWALTYYEATFPANIPAEEFDPPWMVERDWQKAEGTKRRYPPVIAPSASGTKPGYVPSEAIPRRKDGESDGERHEGTKPDAARQETARDEVRNAEREAGNGAQRGMKRRYLEGSIQGSKEDSNVGFQQEGAALSRNTGVTCESPESQETETGTPEPEVLQGEPKPGPRAGRDKLNGGGLDHGSAQEVLQAGFDMEAARADLRAARNGKATREKPTITDEGLAKLLIQLGDADYRTWPQLMPQLNTYAGITEQRVRDVIAKFRVGVRE